MPFSNLAALQHVYGLLNGLLLGGAFIAICSAVSLFLRKNKRLARVHFAIAIGIVAFGLHGLFFQRLYGAVTLDALPEPLFHIGRMGAPLAMLICIYIFTQVFEIRRLQPQFITTYRALYVVYGAIACGLFFVSDDKLTLTLIFASITPLALIGFYYTSKYAKYVYWGGMTRYVFLAAAIIAAYMMWLVGSGNYLKVPIQAILLEHIVSYSLPVIFGFILVRYSEEQTVFMAKAQQYNDEGLLNDLEKAISFNQLSLVYQPQVSLDSQRICGMEALLRWQHPEKGFISPGYFIPLAEQTPLINHVTKWVVTQSLKELDTIFAKHPDIKLSINLSTRNLHASMIRHIGKELAKHRVAPENIVIEITESTFLESSDTIIEALDMINQLGCHLSLDDYGTGFSSLSHINQLALKELKIDRLFVKDIEDNAENYIIVNSTIQMSKSLNLQVVAEGVETQEALDKLQNLHCDIVQGYGIAKPMPVDDLTHWINAYEFDGTLRAS